MFFLFEKKRKRESSSPVKLIFSSAPFTLCSVRTFRLTLPFTWEGRQLPAALNVAKLNFLSLANKRSKHITTTNRLAIHTKYFQPKTDPLSAVDIQTNHDRGWTPQYGIKVHTEGGTMPDVHSAVSERGEILLELMNDVSVCASEFFSKCTNDQIKALCMTNTEAGWTRLVNTSTVSKQKHEMERKEQEQDAGSQSRFGQWSLA